MAGWCSGDWKFLLEWNILSFQSNIIVTYTNNKQRSFNIFYLLLCRCGLHFFPKNYVTSMVYWIKSVPCLRIIKKISFKTWKQWDIMFLYLSCHLCQACIERYCYVSIHCLQLWFVFSTLLTWFRKNKIFCFCKISWKSSANKVPRKDNIVSN